MHKGDTKQHHPGPGYLGEALVQEIAREHAAIFEATRQIEQELDRLSEHPEDVGGRWELPDLAKSLRGYLVNHFQLEECGGLLGGDVLASDPEARSAIDELIREHREFERRIDRVIEELDTGFTPTESVQGCFDGELRSLIADMALHESRESRMFHRIVRRADGTKPRQRPGTAAD